MNRLKELRQEKRLTIRELADKVGIAYVSISRLENEVRPFTIDHLERLSKFFDCSYEYLQGTSDKRKNVETKVIAPLPSDIKIAFYNQEGLVTPEQQKMVDDFIAMIKKAEGSK